MSWSNKWRLALCNCTCAFSQVSFNLTLRCSELCNLCSHCSVCDTLDRRYNVLIGFRSLYRVIMRTALYWNEQQKTLVSPSCHIIISLSTDISAVSKRGRCSVQYMVLLLKSDVLADSIYSAPCSDGTTSIAVIRRVLAAQCVFKMIMMWQLGETSVFYCSFQYNTVLIIT